MIILLRLLHFWIFLLPKSVYSSEDVKNCQLASVWRSRKIFQHSWGITHVEASGKVSTSLRKSTLGTKSFFESSELLHNQHGRF